MSWVGAGHVVGQSFWFGSLLVLAALLSPGAFGTVAVGLLMVTAATRLMGSGTRGSMILAPRLTRAHVTTALTVNVATGLALGSAIVVASVPMAHTFAHGADPLVLAVLGASVALYAPSIVPLTLLEKQLQFKRRASVQASAATTAAIVSIAAGLLGAGVWSLVIRQVVFQALLATLGWVAARPLIPPRVSDPDAPRFVRLKRQGAMAFVLFSLTDFVVFNADYLTVGHFTDTTQLGLYSLGYTLAFAPVSQFSVQLGSVLFPAAAASDAETIRRRTIRGVRLSCLVLFPLIPVAFVLAPVVIPAVLGARWEGMVVPFQILLAVGVAHAVVNVIGESLSGTGHIDFRAWINVVWMLAMIGALVVLVQADGIRGAALAHLILYVPVALAYGFWGMRLLGAKAGQLGGALGAVGGMIALQAVVTIAVVASLMETSVPEAVRVALAAGAGLAAGVCLVVARGGAALMDARSFVTGKASSRSRASA